MSAMPNRDRLAERREATRREIVDAAWAIASKQGLAGVTLREVAARVGMRSPSLYSHFASKNAIFDAMFGQAWADYLRVCEVAAPATPKPPRKALLFMARTFVDFALVEPARFQLMNQRMLPDFTPTPESYAPSVQVLVLLGEQLARIGVHAQADADLFVALIGGLIDVQLANDPGGERWIRLLPRTMDMFADDLGLPGPRLRSKR